MKKESNRNIIARLREKARLSQPGLAEKTGINIRQIQKYESGELKTENMTLKNACMMASVLGCPVEDLIKPEDDSLKINKSVLKIKIRKEYSSGRSWERIDFGNWHAMRIDLSDAGIWCDCLQTGDSKRYKSDTIETMVFEAKYGPTVDAIEREYLEIAVKLLRDYGWEICE